MYGMKPCLYCKFLGEVINTTAYHSLDCRASSKEITCFWIFWLKNATKLAVLQNAFKEVVSILLPLSLSIAWLLFDILSDQ